APVGWALQGSTDGETWRTLDRRSGEAFAWDRHGHPHARNIATVLFRPRFPTDIRHNSKIDRARLAAYAATGGRP
ncbi:hypothetical protein ABZ322_43935, partial [Streptomyces sp. NPDC006129]|uniref:hypothetical protein n=1 Tax=Streptomyces sp. NPDC006129 TaxID=3155348 RepID=UPI0033BD5D98